MLKTNQVQNVSFKHPQLWCFFQNESCSFWTMYTTEMNAINSGILRFELWVGGTLAVTFLERFWIYQYRCVYAVHCVNTPNAALLQSELKLETVTLDVLALVLVKKSHNIFSCRQELGDNSVFHTSLSVESSFWYFTLNFNFLTWRLMLQPATISRTDRSCCFCNPWNPNTGRK